MLIFDIKRQSFNEQIKAHYYNYKTIVNTFQKTSTLCFFACGVNISAYNLSVILICARILIACDPKVLILVARNKVNKCEIPFRIFLIKLSNMGGEIKSLIILHILRRGLTLNSNIRQSYKQKSQSILGANKIESYVSFIGVYRRSLD